ncbi:MAG: 2-amino-4-hydroxy-6-hydroxymethyldihydropteridine diphosphokinase [Candidatus Obscuribacterales bacterium]|nr:2-amino-4-hydroxy-6-hydroxymethyldihydropteridine diphosphokinase [Candidatus Obscuribacterales bacterium]
MTQQRKFRGNQRKVTAYLGLGSNEGDRVGFIQQAVQLLKDFNRIKVVECSSLYETEPIGEEYSEWFVNAVLIIETELSCEELLDVLKDIEARLSELSRGEATKGLRPREPRGLTKIIDLDILFFGNEVLETSYLHIPHPRLHRRAFALVPLLEIAPDLVHPSLDKSIAQLHEELPEPEQVFLYGTRRPDEGNG